MNQMVCQFSFNYVLFGWVLWKKHLIKCKHGRKELTATRFASSGETFSVFIRTALWKDGACGEKESCLQLWYGKKKETIGACTGFAMFLRCGGGRRMLVDLHFCKSVRLRVGNKLPGGEAPENTSALWKSFIFPSEDDCWLPNLLFQLFINLRRSVPYERNLLHYDPSPLFRKIRFIIANSSIPLCPLRGWLCLESTRRLLYSYREEAAVINRRQDVPCNSWKPRASLVLLVKVLAIGMQDFGGAWKVKVKVECPLELVGSFAASFPNTSSLNTPQAVRGTAHNYWLLSIIRNVIILWYPWTQWLFHCSQTLRSLDLGVYGEGAWPLLAWTFRLHVMIGGSFRGRIALLCVKVLFHWFCLCLPWMLLATRCCCQCRAPALQHLLDFLHLQVLAMIGWSQHLRRRSPTRCSLPVLLPAPNLEHCFVWCIECWFVFLFCLHRKSTSL